VLWLDASQETGLPHGAEMSVWSDRSGHLNHATQTIGSSRPIYSTAGVNNLPTVVFNRAAGFLMVADSDSLHFGIDDFAVMVVARGAPPQNSDATLLLKQEAMPPYRGVGLSLNAGFSLRAAAQIDATIWVRSYGYFDDDLPRLISGRLLSTGYPALEIRINGGSQGRAIFDRRTDISAAGQALLIGGSGPSAVASSGFRTFRGSISEIVAVRGPLAEDELAMLEIYLLAKYGL
jgi:hypothetical protein